MERLLARAWVLRFGYVSRVWATALMQLGFAAGMAPRAVAFASALGDPARSQSARLRRFLRENAATAYGRAHGFGEIASVREFQDRVPMVDYEALEPFVDRIARGEANVLTRAPVKMMERTSGSTARGKLIPYTDALLADFSAATGPWLVDLMRSVSGMRGRRQYWSVSPATTERRRTEGGLPIGFDDDTEYFGPAYRYAMSQVMAVPSTVARTADVDAWRLKTLEHLVAAEDLGFISVWSPTFLTLLMEELVARFDEVLARVPSSRAMRVRRAVERAGRIDGEAIWPGLSLISCWCDGPSAALVAGLRRYFPRVTIQPKGLLATEGVVTFPLWDHEGGVAAVTSHFLEFLPVDGPANARPKLVHELRIGEAYSPLLTTGGGFARYHLKDVVRCIGHVRQTPLLRFEGKLDRVSDLVGEKLHAREVERALEAARASVGADLTFAMLSPEESAPRRYRLFVESEAADEALRRLADAMDRVLSEGVHYGYARKLGQLGAIEPVRIRDGWRTWERAMQEKGMRLGDIKPTVLGEFPSASK